MVSSELIREIETRFTALTRSSIELSNYTGSVFDVAFEITTAETFVAGIASKIIGRNRMTAQDKSLVQDPYLRDGRWWQCDNGSVFDLSVNPEINRMAQAVEQLRASCARALKLKQS